MKEIKTIQQLDLFSDENIAPKYNLESICDPKFTICAQPWTMRLTSRRTWSFATNKKVSVFVPVDLEYPGIAGVNGIDEKLAVIQRAFDETNLSGKEIYLDELYDLCRIETKVEPALIEFMGAHFAVEYVLAALAAMDNPKKGLVDVRPEYGLNDRGQRVGGAALLIRVEDSDARAFIMGCKQVGAP
jgi:hypothetical protein